EDGTVRTREFVAAADLDEVARPPLRGIVRRRARADAAVRLREHALRRKLLRLLRERAIEPDAEKRRSADGVVELDFVRGKRTIEAIRLRNERCRVRLSGIKRNDRLAKDVLSGRVGRCVGRTDRRKLRTGALERVDARAAGG